MSLPDFHPRPLTRDEARAALSAAERAEILAECGCDPKAFAPPHFASSRCESGGRAHCSCDRCF